MLVVSPSMSDKLFQTNATFINIKDVSFDKVRKIYDKLLSSPSLQDEKGNPLIGGQSTLDDEMVVLNFSELSEVDFRTRIEGALTEDNYNIKIIRSIRRFSKRKGI